MSDARIKGCLASKFSYLSTLRTSAFWPVIVRSCIFHPCHSVRHFYQVLHFPPVRFGPSMSGLAMSGPLVFCGPFLSGRPTLTTSVNYESIYFLWLVLATVNPPIHTKFEVLFQRLYGICPKFKNWVSTLPTSP